MHARHYALTQLIAGSYYEAASVCLSRHGSPPAAMRVSDNGTESSAQISWTVPTAQVQGAWNNEIDATEAGAYCCVIAGIELCRRLFAVRRAQTGTGADYYVGPLGAGEEDLEDCIRLEVSGVSDGGDGEVRRRLRGKVQQAQAGSSSLPAVAGVIGFSAKLLMIQDVPEGR